MANLNEIFNGIQKRMTADFESITSQINHNLSKGQSRERVIVREYLSRYIPGHIGVGCGEIISTDGTVSNQIDIVLYDKMNCPNLLLDDGYQIFPIEFVYGVVEVKSELDSSAVEDSMKKIYGVKTMKRAAFEKQKGPILSTANLFDQTWEDYFPTIGFVFGFKGISLEKLRDKTVEINSKVKLHEGIDSLWVLNSGGLVNVNKNTQIIELAPTKQSELKILESQNPLVLLTVQLQTLMSSAKMLSRFRILDYFGASLPGTLR